MRKQLSVANWKMNLSFQEAELLVKNVIEADSNLSETQEIIFAVPAPYLQMVKNIIGGSQNIFTAAQNCSHKTNGAFTGEISAAMLQSMDIQYAIVGHSERREYFNETNAMLAEKVNRCLENSIRPIFCCGESLSIREQKQQKEFVQAQLSASLFNLAANQIVNCIIAYEPIWAIGTGKTATVQQVQEMHEDIRSVFAVQYGSEIAASISILYGGSVKASNAKELFSCNDVDGGLVGRASLTASEFIQISKAMKC